MRPSFFHSRNVGRCVFTSTRLCTCMRSIRFVRRSAIERSIDLIPFSLPRVQTFVARKSLSRIPSVAVRSPITCSARPYIGDESITRPPSFTNRASTSSNCFRLSGARSTSNVRHVPKPITSSFSPEEGIARICIVDDSLAVHTRDAPKSNPAAPAPIKRVASRRVSFSFTGRARPLSNRLITCRAFLRNANSNLRCLTQTPYNRRLHSWKGQRLCTPMPTTRRTFIKLAAAVGGAFGLGIRSTKLFAEKSVKPLRILILGGTGFTGPYQVHYALSRGHRVTVFNRGKTHPGELPKEVEQLIGDRNGQLEALRNRKWDIAIDNPTTLPAWVRDVAQVLKGNVERYVFISTISVYPDPLPAAGVDENSPLSKYDGPDAYKETLEAMRAGGFKTYGPLKVLSEKEAEKWFPGKTLIIRPGLIVGPRDETDRFTYWPVRVDRGGELLGPRNLEDPVQYIDARDLAEWTIRMVENRETGIFNATGPAKPIGVGGMLNGIKDAEKSNATFTFVPYDFLKQQKVEAWSDMPVWAGDELGLSRTKIYRALSKGLTFRPLADTARDTLAWFKALRQDRQSKMRAGITAEREREVLEAWKKKL